MISKIFAIPFLVRNSFFLNIFWIDYMISLALAFVNAIFNFFIK